MDRLTFDEFAGMLMGGESRRHPGVAVSYILLDDGFYTEWAYQSEEDDEEQTHQAYNAYTMEKLGLNPIPVYHPEMEV